MELRPLVVNPSGEGLYPSTIRPAVEMPDESFGEFKWTAKACQVAPAAYEAPEPVITYTLGGIVQAEDGSIDVWPGRYIIVDGER